MMRQTFVEIDLGALKRNAKKLWQLNGSQQYFCPMIKANAYGHGSVECAKSLQSIGVTDLGVSLIEEALWLRQNSVQGNILIFGSFDNGLEEIIENQLVPVISTEQQLRALEKFNFKNTKLKIHLKLNVGMNRLGFQGDELATALARLDDLKAIQIVGALSHLSEPEDMDQAEGLSFRQFEVWKKNRPLFAARKIPLHLWSSSGLVHRFKSQLKDMSHEGSRPGLALYGMNYPTISDTKFDPVMTFKARVVAARTLSKGDCVSYGGTWVAAKETVLGTVAAGYADGVSRSLSNQAEVTIEGQRYPIRGRVCMDYFMIDLGISKPAADWVDKEVIIFGNQGVQATELAAIQKTSAYEVLTQVSSRVPRRFINAQ